MLSRIRRCGKQAGGPEGARMTIVIGDAAEIPPGSTVGWLTVGNTRATPVMPIEIYKRDIQKLDKRIGNHVYLICTMPRLRIAQNAKFTSNGNWRIDVSCNSGSSTQSRRTLSIPQTRLPFDAGDNWTIAGEGTFVEYGDEADRLRLPATRLVSDYLGRVASPGRANLVNKFFALDVCYVGQAYANGKRTATDRLTTGHEKLQEVLAELHAYQPSVEVLLVLVDCSVPKADSRFSIGPGGSDPEEVQRSIQGILRANAQLPEDKDRIVTIMEAALIRHFKPRMNTEYLTFPQEAHSSYAPFLTEGGFDLVGVHLDVSPARVTLKDADGTFKDRMRVYWELCTSEVVVPPSVLDRPHTTLAADQAQPLLPGQDTSIPWQLT